MNKSLELPWSMEETIENMRNLRDILIDQVSNTNYEGKGKTDAKEIKFDFDRAIYALEQQLADAWIPISSGKLPKKEGNYLVYDENNQITLEYFYKNKDTGWCNPYFTTDYNVIAWRPLPQPYKEDTNETI